AINHLVKPLDKTLLIEALHHHQVGQGTCTPKLLRMLGAPKKSPARGRANGGSAHIGKGPVHHAPEPNLTTRFCKRNLLIARAM
ncbi:hypothetical protein, partial [Paraburkholderia solitsugae]|uniref:hypothetical protein n=1 Tax=Paraburkholderia solitsugae TaxID=2675748 RepID=UPI001C12D282